MRVANVGKTPPRFEVGRQSGYDRAGRRYEPDAEAGLYLQDANRFVAAIRPGAAVEGTVVFDLPARATLVGVELHDDSPFSGGVQVALSR